MLRGHSRNGKPSHPSSEEYANFRCPPTQGRAVPLFGCGNGKTMTRTEAGLLGISNAGNGKEVIQIGKEQ
jgi:hypothetical protein